ncbi:mycofactocin-coupled SDR family oxidoreductase [Gordonia pseudamarae]|jgi:SDR family mycofactocin-dependent oxidoreductase|uniref:Mycofactocin-coupled SDR family oxidoreductase n=1 Tax=Gordonia pseudamarae TaxID=2831662 RepID=A0ABX6IKE8_9ACTN|nr:MULTISPECIES: mycofactocin-coupled SDR family oxidoreductase [Gordonia]MBD0021111.1 mycofactocin-coupled SDR family oxidoreductase [Gordonia sp. (in: high G+C Gram-positive bacteria)]QHN27483.1 mycofactocin-coupled SDR family oxidoreductase [Gordonia pseudamarae]QHN36367.1 mycofactocin-coupled SDR family oxidoreductase [Gordonia pseudamarae]
MGNFDGKVVYITGIARGQGRNHALRFAREGASIIGLDIAGPIAEHTTYPPATREDLDETVRLVEEAGGKILARQGDVRDLAFQQQLVADGVAQFGGLDFVVVNAGVLTWALTWEMTEEQFTDVIDINLVGAWKTLRAALPVMIEGGNGGSVVVVSSVAGLKAMPVQASYSASKYGLTGLAQTLAKEAAPYQIRVNSLHPYAVNTLMGVGDTSAVEAFVDPKFSRYFPSMMDHNPIADPDEISDAILYLCSDSAKSITGVQFPVDMGHSKV